MCLDLFYEVLNLYVCILAGVQNINVISVPVHVRFFNYLVFILFLITSKFIYVWCLYSRFKT